MQLRSLKTFEPVQFYVHFKAKDTKHAIRLLKVKTIIFGTFSEDMGKFFTVTDLLKSPDFTSKFRILSQEVCFYLFSSGRV